MQASEQIKLGSGAVVRSTPRRDGPSGSRAEPWPLLFNLNLQFPVAPAAISLSLRLSGDQAFHGSVGRWWASISGPSSIYSSADSRAALPPAAAVLVETVCSRL